MWTAKLDLLRRLQPLAEPALTAVRHALDVELTDASNAIEGATLIHGETALVIEKRVTIGGKTLTEHLEAVDHDETPGLMRAMGGCRPAFVSD
jgi:Fic family protein